MKWVALIGAIVWFLWAVSDAAQGDSWGALAMGMATGSWIMLTIEEFRG